MLSRRVIVPALVCALLPLFAGCGHHHPGPPHANDVSYELPENTILSDTLDTDNLDDDTATFYIDQGPLNGNLFVDRDSGDFSYTPDNNFVGDDNFYWDVTDQWGDSNVAEVFITVYDTSTTQVEVRPVAGPLLADLK